MQKFPVIARAIKNRMKKTPEFSIVYFGTPRFSVFVLDALDKAGLTPAVVVTQPDRPAGRGLALRESPVKSWARAHDIPMLQEAGSLKLEAGSFNLFIVAAYGKILPPEILALPTHGTLNVHPSLLPKFRGPSPIESQILEDDRECGVTIIKLDEEMDHGPIVAQASITPDPWPMRIHDLEDLLWTEGGRLLTDAIPPYMEGSIAPEPQDHTKATFTKKMTKEDGLLDLPAGRQVSPQDAYQNYLKFCAYDGWPGTYFLSHNKRIKITDAEYKNGAFVPLRVIPEGKKEIHYVDFLNGVRPQ